MSDSNNPPETCLPTTTWFLHSEDDKAMGGIYRRDLLEAGVQIDEREGFAAAQVVSFTELRATCAMRRFKVLVRPIS